MNVEHCLTTLCHVEGSQLFSKALAMIKSGEYYCPEMVSMVVDRKQLLTELQTLFDMVDKLK